MVFSPWAPPTKICPPASASSFDFTKLVANAVRRDENSQKPTHAPHASPSPFSSPLTSPELEPVNTLPLDVPHLALHSDVDIAMHSPASSPPSAPAFPTLEAARATTSDIPPLAHMTEAERRKAKLTARRRVKRYKEKVENTAHPSGHNAVRPKSLNKHVRPATSHPIDMRAQDLNHTAYAWTGTKDKVAHKKVFALQDLIGANSKFGFTLQPWDGKYVALPFSIVSYLF